MPSSSRLTPKKKLLVGPLDWITLAPFLTGVTAGLVAWAADLDSGVALAAGVILVLASAGIYLHRLLFGWQENYEKVVAEWRATIENTRESELDRLYRELSKDGDPRTEAGQLVDFSEHGASLTMFSEAMSSNWYSSRSVSPRMAA